jgi:hypothetical protein
MSKVSSGETKNTLYCSFCGKSQHEVRKLIGRAPRMSFAVPEYRYVVANNRVLLVARAGSWWASLPMQRPMSEGRWGP